MRLPDIGAIYGFWWIGQVDDLKNASRKIVLRGPGGDSISVRYEFDFPKNLKNYPLYIGKTTNLHNRIRQHIMPAELKRVHGVTSNHVWGRPHNTSCQLRAGIEHIFPKEKLILDLIKNNIGISYLEMPGHDNMSRRFYLEDFAIGYLRPWFNLDSER